MQHFSVAKLHTTRSVTCLSPRNILALARAQHFQKAQIDEIRAVNKLKDNSSEVAQEHKLAAALLWLVRQHRGCWRRRRLAAGQPSSADQMPTGTQLAIQRQLKDQEAKEMGTEPLHV